MALGDTNIIGDVTRTMKNLLADLDITLESPATLPTGGIDDFKKLNLYLYQVLENPFAKNQLWRTVSPTIRQYPPLALDLYYLLTPYAKDMLSAHQVLSHAMRVLYDNAIVSGSQLAGSLAVNVEQLAIVLCPMTIEDLTRIWNALQSPYRLSVCYEARIALIQSEIREEVTRVKEKIDVLGQI